MVDIEHIYINEDSILFDMLEIKSDIISTKNKIEAQKQKSDFYEISNLFSRFIYQKIDPA